MRFVAFTGPKGSGKDTAYEILRDAKRVDGKISFAGPLKAVCSEVFNLHLNLLNDPVLKEKELKEPIRLTAKHIRKIRDLCEDYVNPVTKDGILLYRSNAISVVGLEGREFKTPRELLQIIGTELIRDRVWRDWHKTAAFSGKVLDAVREDDKGNKRRVYKQDGIYAITDLRFLDEHEFLLRMGKAYKPYYVARPEAEDKLAQALASGKAHQSESETAKLKEILKDSIIDNSGSLDDLKVALKDLDLGSSKVLEEVPTKGSKFKYGLKGE